MLIKEGGIDTLKYLEATHTEDTSEPSLQSLCRAILETLESNSY